MIYERMLQRTHQFGQFTAALWGLLWRCVAIASLEEALKGLLFRLVTLCVRRSESGGFDSPSFGARERLMTAFRPLMLQCAVDPVDRVTTINTFVLRDPLLFDFVYEALENGGTVPGQLGCTGWYIRITYVGLLRIETKPTSGPDIIRNDRPSVLLREDWGRQSTTKHTWVNGWGGRR